MVFQSLEKIVILIKFNNSVILIKFNNCNKVFSSIVRELSLRPLPLPEVRSDCQPECLLQRGQKASCTKPSLDFSDALKGRYCTPTGEKSGRWALTDMECAVAWALP